MQGSRFMANWSFQIVDEVFADAGVAKDENQNEWLAGNKSMANNQNLT